MMKPGVSASSPSTRAGRNAPSLSSPETRSARPRTNAQPGIFSSTERSSIFLARRPGAGADHDPSHEADGEHYQDDDDLPELPAGRERRRDRRQQREDAGERLCQQQDGQVDRQHDEQSTNQGRLGQLGQALHAAVLLVSDRCASLALPRPAEARTKNAATSLDAGTRAVTSDDSMSESGPPFRRTRS